MKKIRLMMIGVLLVVLSGCFPVFIPEDGDHRGHERHDRDEHRDHDHDHDHDRDEHEDSH
jgi:hypothetical protein